VETWKAFIQTIVGALFISLVGGLWAMYNRVQGHSDKITQAQKDIAEQDGRLTAYSERLRSVEILVTRIDTNVTALLRSTERRDRIDQ
jgi:hypothetical protein